MRIPTGSCPTCSKPIRVAERTAIALLRIHLVTRRSSKSDFVIGRRLAHNHYRSDAVARAHADAPSIDVAMSAATAGPENNSALVRERHIAPRTTRSPIPGYSSSTGAIALSIQP